MTEINLNSTSTLTTSQLTMAVLQAAVKDLQAIPKPPSITPRLVAVTHQNTWLQALRDSIYHLWNEREFKWVDSYITWKVINPGEPGFDEAYYELPMARDLFTL
jgi:hypothetical protein